MAVRIAINGLGRIGRCVLRAVAEYARDKVTVVAINGPAPVDTHIHLLGYDSVHGRFPGIKKIDEHTLDMGYGPIQVFHERDPEKLPWRALHVDVVLECTGVFKKHADVSKHLKAGAKKVLISSPSPDPDITVVYGVNEGMVKPGHKVVSIGSCTTNCLAPIAKVLHQSIGIEKGFMTTIHAYTNDQQILDKSHEDLRRARAAALSMIPTSTGAAKAIAQVLPELKGKLDGVSIRVPVPNVSLVDFTFTATRKTRVEEINSLMERATEGTLKGILAVSHLPLVSVDFNHQPYSAIYDATGTHVVQDNFCRVAAWYDNEWGFSCRMLDVACLVGDK